MKGVPHPSDDPYAVGDQVRIYIGPDDPDSQYHGRVCEVVEVVEDNLDVETNRALDKCSYKLRGNETESVLPITFRHPDLVPIIDE
jgi:ribosomal protein L21E